MKSESITFCYLPAICIYCFEPYTLTCLSRTLSNSQFIMKLGMNCIHCEGQKNGHPQSTILAPIFNIFVKDQLYMAVLVVKADLILR